MSHHHLSGAGQAEIDTMDMNVDALHALSKLVGDSAGDDVETEEETAPMRRRDITPATISATTQHQGGRALSRPAVKRKSKNIWNLDELPTAAVAVEQALEDADDGRVEPDYEFLYKQAVTANDAYLGMGDKDPSTTQCEDLVLRVNLAGEESVAGVDLDVQPQFAKLKSNLYKLFVYLPHRVDAAKAKAHYDTKKGELRVSMPILRDTIL